MNSIFRYYNLYRRKLYLKIYNYLNNSEIYRFPLVSKIDKILRRLLACQGPFKVQDSKLFIKPEAPVFHELVIGNGYHEEKTTEILKALLGDRTRKLVIDIGANIGYFTLIAAREIGTKGKVLCFEPEEENFSLLLQNIQINRLNNTVIAENKAISDKNGTTYLNIDPRTKGCHSIVFSKNGWTKSQCETVTLDDYLIDFSENHPVVDLIKIDAEGAEFNILKGMEKTIDKSPDLKMILEFAPKLLIKAQSSPQNLIDILRKYFSEEIVLIDDKKMTVEKINFEDLKLVSEGTYNLLLSKQSNR